MIKTMTREEYNKAIGLNDSSNAVTSTVGKMQTMTREEYNAAIGIKKDTSNTGSSGRLQTMTRKEYDSAIKKYGTVSQKKASVSDNMFVYLDKRNAIRNNMQNTSNNTTERNPLLDVDTDALQKEIDALQDRVDKYDRAKRDVDDFNSTSSFRHESTKIGGAITGKWNMPTGTSGVELWTPDGVTMPKFNVTDPLNGNETEKTKTNSSAFVAPNIESKKNSVSSLAGIEDSTNLKSKKIDRSDAEEIDKQSEDISSADSYAKYLRDDYDRIEAQREIVKDGTNLHQELADKKAYLNQAKIAQSQAKLTDDALKASDFKQYSERGKALRDNNDGIFSSIVKKLEEYGFKEATTLGQDFMTDEENDILNYYLAKDEDSGTEQAEEYMRSIQQNLNARIARDRVDKMGSDGEKTFYGWEAGAERHVRNIANFITDVLPIGEDRDFIPNSVADYTIDAINNDLAGDGSSWSEKFFGKTFSQMMFDFNVNGGNMLPSIAASLATGGLLSSAGVSAGAVNAASSWVGNTVMGASVGGEAYKEMVNLGYDHNTARVYAGTMTALELGLGKALGGIMPLQGGKGIDGIINKFVENTNSAAVAFATKLAGNMASEFTEEYLQEFLEPVMQNFFFDAGNDIQFFSAENLYAGLLGAASAGLFDAAPTAIDTVNTSKLGKNLIKSGVTAEEVAKVGNLMSVDSAAYRLAGKINAESSAYSIGRLFTEENVNLSEQNKSDLIEYMKNQGVNDKNAKSMVNGFSRFVERKQSELEGFAYEESQYGDKYVKAALEIADPLAMGIKKIIDDNLTVYQRTQAFFDIQKKLNGDVQQRSEQEIDARLGEYKLYSDLSKKSYGFSPYYAETLGTQGQYEYKDIRDKDYCYDTLKNTGERVYVKEIVSKTEDGMKLRLTDGRTVNSDEISFGSNDLAIIFEAAQRSDIAEKDIIPIVNTYDGKIDGASYIKAAIDIYDGGTLRDKEYYSDIRNPLNNSQTNKIFALGKAYRDSVVRAEDQTSKLSAKAGMERAKAEMTDAQANIPAKEKAARSGPKYSIRKSADGGQYVEVIPDPAYSDSDARQIAKSLFGIVKNKYSSLIDVGGQKIGINKKTAREWQRSRDAMSLYRKDKNVYSDKMNAFENADELLKASKKYVGEGLKHVRKDNFVEFARGEVDFKVGDNGYTADIIVGTTDTGESSLYDIVKIKNKIITGTAKYGSRQQPANTPETTHSRRPAAPESDNTSAEISISQSGGKVNKNDNKIADAHIAAQDRRLAASAADNTSAETSITQRAEKINRIKANKHIVLEGKIELDSLSDFQLDQMDLLGSVAEAFKIPFYFYQSIKEGTRFVREDGKTAPNGYYKDSIIHIDINAGNSGSGVMLYTAAHEITHFMHQWSAKKFDKLARFLVKTYNKSEKGPATLNSLIDAAIKEERNQPDGRRLSPMEAYEEVVADAMQRMFLDTDAAEKFSQFRNEDSDNIETHAKLKGHVQKLLRNLREAFAKKYDQLDPESAAARELMKMEKAARKISRMFKSGVTEAAKRYGAAGGKLIGSETNRENIRKSVRSNLDYNSPINEADIKVIRDIGTKKSINSFSSEEIQKTAKWAHKFYEELGTKSPFFRSWFGDWRAYDTSTVKTIPVSTLEYNNDFVKSIERGTFFNPDSKWNIFVGATGINDTVSHSGYKKISAKMLSEIRSIIENAVLFDTETSLRDKAKKHNDTAFMHKLYSPVSYDGKMYIAKIAVEEYGYGNASGRRFYNLRGIEMTPAAGTPEASASYGTMASQESIDSIADLFSAVKRYDKDFSPKAVNPELLNPDGTPRVFYHGTREENGNFTVFDETKSVKKGGLGLRALGKGNYFTSVQLSGNERYGSRIIPVYLNLQNPLILDGMPFDRVVSDTLGINTSEYSHDEIQQMLRDKGYDGVIQRSSQGNIIANVFDSENIKSANDNIGTFDRSDPDIRYSRRTNPETREALENLSRASEALRKKKINPASILEAAEDITEYYAGALTQYELQTEILRAAAENSHDINKALAQELVENNKKNFVINANSIQQSRAKEYIKKTKFLLTDEVRHAFGSDEELNRFIDEYKDRIVFSDKDGTNVTDIGSAYVELNDIYGYSMFPTSIEDSFGQLMQIARVVDTYIGNQMKFTDESYDSMVDSTALALDQIFKNAKKDTPVSSPRDFLLRASASEIHSAKEYNALKQYRNNVRKAAELEAVLNGQTAKIESIKNDISAVNEDVLAEIERLTGETKETAESSKKAFEKYQTDGGGYADLILERQKLEEQCKLLEAERRITEKRLNAIDGKITELEVFKPLKDIIQRQKADTERRINEIRQAKKAQRSRLLEVQKKLTVNKNETVKAEVKKEAVRRDIGHYRGEIVTLCSQLSEMLVKPTKARHIPENMRTEVADILDSIGVDEKLSFNIRVTKKERRAAQHELEVARSELENAQKNKNIADDQLVELQNRVRQAEEAVKNLDNPRRMTTERMGKLLDGLHKIMNSCKSSNDPGTRVMYDEYFANYISEMSQAVTKKTVAELTIDEIISVRNVLKGVVHRITNGNNMFAEGIRTGRVETSSLIEKELAQSISEKKHTPRQIFDRTREYAINNLEPLSFFDICGSETLRKIGQSLIESEDIYARDIYQAYRFFNATYDKYTKELSEDQKKQWNPDRMIKVSFIGRTESYTLGDIMAIYATYRRTQGKQHLLGGGVTLHNKKAFRIGRDEITGKIRVELAESTQKNAYTHTEDEVQKLTSKLTKEQKEFAVEMDEFLSTVVAGWGNEVTMAMYGFRNFTEENYFPIKVDRGFAKTLTAVDSKGKKHMHERDLTRPSFAKPTVDDASGAIEIGNFFDVWAQHVHEMATFHAFARGISDLRYIRDCSVDTQIDHAGAKNIQTVRNLLDVYGGKGMDQYLSDFISDVAGGTLAESRGKLTDAMYARFKKGAVLYSLSSAIQQPTSVCRAMAMVAPKYFAESIRMPNRHTVKARMEEMKKYAPVAILKEIGGFDTGIGRSATEYLVGRKSLLKSIDSFGGALMEKGDAFTWRWIWEACKREQAEKSNLPIGSEELLRLAGKRFSEVIRRTQVYDSPMSKSAVMRSSGGLDKLATSFAAEPTKTANMLFYALRAKEKGERARYIAAVVASIALGAAAKSLPYAMRDDDDDRTLIEKYVKELPENFIGDLNPLTLLPYVRDLWSIAQGYDVERGDIAVLGDLIEQISKLPGDTPIAEKLSGFISSLCGVAGVPAGNIIREIKAVFNFFISIPEWSDTTWQGITNAALQGLEDATPAIMGKMIESRSESEKRADRLYEAIVSGSSKEKQRAEDALRSDREKRLGMSASEDAIDTAVKNGLRRNDARIAGAALDILRGDYRKMKDTVSEITSEKNFTSQQISDAVYAEKNAIERRIRQAAQAKIDGDESGRIDVTLELKSDYRKYFDSTTKAQDFFVNAVNKKADGLKASGNKASEEDGEGTSYYTPYKAYQVADKLDSGDVTAAVEIAEDIVQAKMYAGKTEKEARASVRSSVTRYFKPLYQEAYKNRDSAEMTRIRKLLMQSRLYGGSTETSNVCRRWAAE